jgi:hypothetical protein
MPKELLVFCQSAFDWIGGSKMIKEHLMVKKKGYETMYVNRRIKRLRGCMRRENDDFCF